MSGWSSLFSGKAPRVFVVLFSVLVLARCAALPFETQTLPTAVVLPPLGQIFKGRIDIADKLIPLPAGVFTLTGTRIQPNQKGGYNISVMLVDVNGDNRMTGAVEIFTNLRLRRKDGAGEPKPGWATHSSCNRDDMHFVEVIKNERLGNQDCWWVNHWRMSRGGVLAQAEHWRETRKYLSDNKVYAPIEMMGISFRLANADDFITMNVFKNPEEAGFAPAVDDNWAVTTWKTSLWHPDKVESSPRRKNYVDKQIAFGREFRTRLLKALR